MEINNRIFTDCRIEFHIFEKKNAIDDMAKYPYCERLFSPKCLKNNKLMVGYLISILKDNFMVLPRVLSTTYFDYETDDETGYEYIHNTLQHCISHRGRDDRVYDSTIRIHIFAGKTLYDKLKELHCQ